MIVERRTAAYHRSMQRRSAPCTGCAVPVHRVRRWSAITRYRAIYPSPARLARLTPVWFRGGLHDRAAWKASRRSVGNRNGPDEIPAPWFNTGVRPCTQPPPPNSAGEIRHVVHRQERSRRRGTGVVANWTIEPDSGNRDVVARPPPRPTLWGPAELVDRLSVQTMPTFIRRLARRPLHARRPAKVCLVGLRRVPRRGLASAVTVIATHLGFYAIVARSFLSCATGPPCSAAGAASCRSCWFGSFHRAACGRPRTGQLISAPAAPISASR